MQHEDHADRGSPAPDPDLVRFAVARWIRDRREAAGISQERLRRRLQHHGHDVNQATISRWERGEAMPSFELLADFARAVGSTLASLEEALSRARSLARNEIDRTGTSFDELLDEGDRAARAGLLPRAAARLEAALDLLTLRHDKVPPGRKALLLLRLTWLHLHLWHLERARSLLREISALDGLDEPSRAKALLLRLDLAWRFEDRVEEEILARLVREKMESWPRDSLAAACQTLAARHYAAEQHSEALPLFDRAEALWQEKGNDLEVCRCRAGRGYTLGRTADLDAGLDALLSAARLAARIRSVDAEAFAVRLRGRLLAESGRDVPGGIELLEEAAALARRAGFEEDEFVTTWHAWRLAPPRERGRFRRRLQRLLARVSPHLPEVRAWHAAMAEDKEDER